MTTPTPTPIKTYEHHRYAELFPMLDDSSDAFRGLVDDIRSRGQQEPAWLFEGKILDGRNRHRACQILKLDLNVREYTGADPIGFVLSANLHRRHLNESQRAMVAGKLTNLEVGSNQHTKEGTPIGAASKLLSVGRGSIDRARRVLNSGDPSLVEAVEKGVMKVSTAAEEVAAKRKPGTDSHKEKNRKTKSPNTTKEFIAILEQLIDKLTEFTSVEHAKEYADKTKERLDQTIKGWRKEKEAA